jgi:twinkle protein
MKTHTQQAFITGPYVTEHKLEMTTERKPYLPWVKSHDSFYFRPGEMTVWAGQNGQGKSLWLFTHITKQTK